MLVPHQYFDLNITVLETGAEIIKILKKRRIIAYSELLKAIIGEEIEDQKIISEIKITYRWSLYFLFLLGLIEYHLKIDSFEYIGV